MAPVSIGCGCVLRIYACDFVGPFVCAIVSVCGSFRYVLLFCSQVVYIKSVCVCVCVSTFSGPLFFLVPFQDEDSKKRRNSIEQPQEGGKIKKRKARGDE